MCRNSFPDIKGNQVEVLNSSRCCELLKPAGRQADLQNTICHCPLSCGWEDVQQEASQKTCHFKNKVIQGFREKSLKGIKQHYSVSAFSH
jgi:hypothetical protein